MNNDFNNKTVLITGATRGIGKHTSDLFEKSGANLILTGTKEDEIQKLNDKYKNCNRKYFLLDLKSENSINNFLSKLNSYNKIDILVNNAGINILDNFIDVHNKDYDLMLSINLKGAFLLSQYCAKKMINNGYGRIVSIGSSAGKTGGSKDTAAYGVSKAGVHALAKAIATEYAPYGITSNALAPALINTDMVKGIADLADRIPVGRLGEAKDVARAVLFLLSESSSFITGEVMDINGGFLID